MSQAKDKWLSDQQEKEIMEELAVVNDNAPEVREMTEEEFLSDPENIKGSLTLANEFLQLVGDRWFTVEQLMKRSGMDRMQAIQKLQMVKKFGHAKVRLGSYQDKQKYFREPLWAIQISAEQRLRVLDAVILDCQHQLDKLNLERRSILLEIEKGQTVN